MAHYYFMLGKKRIVIELNYKMFSILSKKIYSRKNYLDGVDYVKEYSRLLSPLVLPHVM